VVQARRSNRRKTATTADQTLIRHGLREIVLIFFWFVGLYLFVSLLTYSGYDPGWSRSGYGDIVRNKGGVAGAVFADIFFELFGYFAYLFPIMVGYMGWLIYKGKYADMLAEPRNLIMPGVGFILTLSAGCGLAIVHFTSESILLPSHAGGVLGMAVGKTLENVFDQLGATLLLLALFFTGVTLLTGLSWLKLMDTLGFYTLKWLPIVEHYLSTKILPVAKNYSQQGLETSKHVSKKIFHKVKTKGQETWQNWQERRRQKQYDYYDDDDQYYDDDHRYEEDYDYVEEKTTATTKPKQTTVKQTAVESEELVNEVDVEPVVQPKPSFKLPALHLLNPLPVLPDLPTETYLTQWILKGFQKLEIDAEIKNIYPGPVLSGFEVEIVNELPFDLETLSQELQQVLEVDWVKTVETKLHTFGIEVANVERRPIYFKALLESQDYQTTKMSLPIALGQDVHGQPVIIDLTRIPHIIMAGSHLADKQKAIHTLLLSQIYKASPEKVRFILIDDKTAELEYYTDIPHLLTPIINNIAQIPATLKWCVQEMEQRYRKMSEMGVRNIEGYNEVIKKEEYFVDSLTETPQPLPYIVVVIYELAELMMTEVGLQTEESITLLTQKSRAAGIHLILATQFPSVNVITGLLKNNIPTRLAFQVTNKSESRAIVGQMGAETLLGDSDMLYMTAGTGMPVRVHGGTIMHDEVKQVTDDLRRQAEPEYVSLS